MARYDIESLLSDVETTLKAGMAAKISALNSEKNDNVTLVAINELAYFCQSMDGRQANWDPFIHYGVTSFEENDPGGYGMTVLTANVDIIVVCADEGQDVNMWKRMYRYQRAIREILEESFFIQQEIKASITNLVPVELALLNNSFTHKAIGVSIRAEMG